MKEVLKVTLEQKENKEHLVHVVFQDHLVPKEKEEKEDYMAR